MSKDDLLALLAQYADAGPVDGHINADQALIDYIDDADIAAAYQAVRKIYQ